MSTGAQADNRVLTHSADVAGYLLPQRAARAAKKPTAYIVAYKSVPAGQIEAASYAAGQSLMSLMGQGKVTNVRRLNGLRTRPAFVVQTRGNVSMAELRDMLQGSASAMSTTSATGECSHCNGYKAYVALIAKTTCTYNQGHECMVSLFALPVGPEARSNIVISCPKKCTVYCTLTQ